MTMPFFTGNIASQQWLKYETFLQLRSKKNTCNVSKNLLQKASIIIIIIIINIIITIIIHILFL